MKLLRHFGQGSTTPHSADDVAIDIQLMTSGHIFVTPPEDPLWPHARNDDLPRNDEILSGGLDLFIRRGSGGVKCGSIRVGIRTIFDLKVAGRWIRDIILNKSAEVLGAGEHGILLEEGIHRFEFTLVLPASIAPEIHLPEARIIQELYAELDDEAQIGGPDRPIPSAQPPALRKPTLRTAFPFVNADNLAASRRELPIAKSDARVTAKRNSGQRNCSRTLMIIHNPDPRGGSCDLDVRMNGFAAGLGVWDIWLRSDVFTIGGPVHARLDISSIDSRTSIFAWHLMLKQTSIVSVPDALADQYPRPERNSALEVMQIGQARPKGLAPISPLWPAADLEAHAGSSYSVEQVAMMPKEDVVRPSTLPGISTPIAVHHEWVSEVYFSVQGEDERGQPLPSPGPGGLRVLRSTKPIILPSCALIPARLSAPYYSVNCADAAPCPTCGFTPPEQICSTCPPSLPHVRHDLPASLPYTKDGTCTACRARFAPVLDPIDFEMCACRLDQKEAKARMAKFKGEDLDAGAAHLLVQKRAAEGAR